MKNPNYWEVPQPDPVWDYAELWKLLQHGLKPDLEALLTFMANIEDVTHETDVELAMRLKMLQHYIDRCNEMLKGSDRSSSLEK